MASVISALGKEAASIILEPELATASKLLNSLVEEKAYVGEVYSLGYEEALVQIHDFHRQQVGGIPALSFLIATRVQSSRPTDVREEDAAVILLRVLDNPRRLQSAAMNLAAEEGDARSEWLVRCDCHAD